MLVIENVCVYSLWEGCLLGNHTIMVMDADSICLGYISPGGWLRDIPGQLNSSCSKPKP
jgi:hypothetical protein